MSLKRLLGRYTLMQQWLAATVLALIPLLIAVSYAAYAFQQQTQQQRRLVDSFDLYNRKAAAVGENIRELVRLGRQYQLLEDPSFLELSRQKRASLQKHLAPLRANFQQSAQRKLLNDLSRDVEDTFALLAQEPPREDEQLTTRLQSLVNSADRLVAEVNRLGAESIQAGEEGFNRILEQLLLFSLLALPGTLLLLVLGNYTISRPIWRLSEAIRALGTNSWDKPIEIRGPSDLTALGDNLEWMRQQILHSEQQKTAFIQHVTHELKTPLAAIIEAGNLLNDEITGPISTEQTAVLTILRQNSRNLQELIEQLLNYNAVSYGIMTHFQPVDLASLCERIRRGLEIAAPDRGISWQFVGEPAEVSSDPRLLEMILKNLMGNALQYSPDGGSIRVHWRMESDHWTLSVSDQGPGIADDEIGKIFLPFYKGRTGRRDRAPKNGIGLAIVNECVKLLKADIETRSVVSKGTTFYLRFPVERQK